MVSGEFKMTVDPLPRIEGLRWAVQRRIAQRAIRRASKELQGVVKTAAAKGHGRGDLSKAIGTKVTVKKAIAYGVVGPKRGYWKVRDANQKWVRGKGKWSAFKKANKEVKTIKPTMYAYFKERGHGGKRGPAEPHPFLKPSLGNGVRFIEIMRQDFAAGVAEELAK